MQKKISGFSLVELMVVIAILGLLAGIAAPTYTKYVDRGYIAEGVTTLSQYKTSLGVFWSTKGYLPGSGDTVPGGPIDLPVGTVVDDEDFLPSTVESIIYEEVTAGATATIKLVFTEDSFPAFNANNRTLYLGIKTKGNKIFFECGNLTDGVTKGSCCGFVDKSVLPRGCDYQGIQSWLST